MTQVASVERTIGYWFLFFSQLSSLSGGVYTLNQICDIKTDRRNRKLFFLPEGIISVRAAWIFTIVLDAAAVIMAWPFGTTYVGLTAVIVLLGIVYSVGARPWKNRPWLGLVANAIGHGALVYLLGATFASQPVLESWRGAIAYSVAVAGVYLATTVPDLEGDLEVGKRTAAVAWGSRTVRIVALGCVTITVVLAATQTDRYLAFAGASAWPFFLRAVLHAQASATAAKAAVAALSIAAAVAYPSYAVILVVGFLATRLFFRWRFGMTYPTLT